MENFHCNLDSEQPAKKDPVKLRFFSFFYSFSTKHFSGFGNLQLKIEKFPSKNRIKDIAAKLVSEDHNVQSWSVVNICILNWVEMTEEDYNRWTS